MVGFGCDRAYFDGGVDGSGGGLLIFVLIAWRWRQFLREFSLRFEILGKFDKFFWEFYFKIIFLNKL